ncbi:DUF3995 domain-containing protein [Rossellomorea sp. BNER]|uniref:DUF3995 domain-containing protein n=1 Tax=Rossellomorea sp. BNER TaxID=2962031 RepID=UPI003AF24BE3|nr:DUF3995 domain-containing protein [Rossellomorea sp. BNER]
MEKRLKWSAYIASLSALLYALPHFWWGLGIGFMFPGDFETAPDDFFAKAIGYWVMGGLALVAAWLAFRFTRSSSFRPVGKLMIVSAWIGSAGLTLWGFSYFVLQFQLAIGRVQSAPAFAAQDASPMAIWGLFWYSLFLIGGVSIGFASYYAQKIQRQARHSQDLESDEVAN